MIALLKAVLRSWVLTRDEKELLAETPRAVQQLLDRVLRFDQRAVVQALAEPVRWQPEVEPVTASDASAWGAAMLSPVGRKMDVVMINMVQDHAQRAIQSPAAELHRAAGFAAGFRASWETAKSLSTIAGADAGTTEDGADTGATNLEHLNP